MAQTIGDVRKLIRKAKTIHIRPFFGTMERWTKITKSEAIYMFSAYRDENTLLEAFDFDLPIQIDETGGLDLG